MLQFNALAQQCAPSVHPTTMAAVVQVESTFNPFAIGVVGGHLVRQPTNQAEALATAKALAAAGYNFSLGIGQINRANLASYGLDYQRVFDPCANLKAASRILQACFERAKKSDARDQYALRKAFSCYYSGNLATGFQTGPKGQPSYVQQVLNGARGLASAQQAPPMRAGPRSPVKRSAPARIDVSAMGESSPTSDTVMVYR